MKKVYKSGYLKNVSKILTLLLLLVVIVASAFLVFAVIHFLIDFSLKYINNKFNSNKYNTKQII